MKNLCLIITFCISAFSIEAQDFSVLTYEWGCSTPFGTSATQADNPLGTLCYNNTFSVSGLNFITYWNPETSSWWGSGSLPGDIINNCASLTTAGVGRVTFYGNTGNILDDINGSIQTGSGIACVVRVPSTTAAVPTMGEWGLLCLGLILTIVSVSALKMKRISIHRA